MRVEYGDYGFIMGYEKEGGGFLVGCFDVMKGMNQEDCYLKLQEVLCCDLLKKIVYVFVVWIVFVVVQFFFV